jgi:hypothetical protein
VSEDRKVALEPYTTNLQEQRHFTEIEEVFIATELTPWQQSGVSSIVAFSISCL